MKKLLVSLFLCCCVVISVANEIPALLSELDKAIKERPLYVKKRLEYLAGLNKILDNSETNEQRYHILGELYSGYSSFNADSSLYVARAIYEVAQRINNEDYRINAIMNMAEISGVTGMFKEALDLMKKLIVNDYQTICVLIIIIFIVLYMEIWLTIRFLLPKRSNTKG